jgi:hypothetical protein
MRSPLLHKKSVSPVRQGDLGALCQTVLGILDLRRNLGTGRAPEELREVYGAARHKLRELYRGILAALPRHARRLIAEARYAKWDLGNADEYALSGDHAMAVQCQYYAALKMSSALAALRQGKVAYGYDISGEVGEVWHGTEDLANQENQKNIDDTAQPFEQHETTPNPANVTRDYQAERDYPSLAERKSKRVHWPPRLR